MFVTERATDNLPFTETVSIILPLDNADLLCLSDKSQGW